MVVNFLKTIKDVAELAKVSTATVSRYYRDNTLVKEETQERIRIAIDKLNYTPNSLAGMLKSNKTNTIGLIISDSSNIFFNQLIYRLNLYFSEKNKEMFVLYNDGTKRTREIIRRLLSFRVEALLFMPNAYSKTIENLLTSNACYPLQLFLDYYQTMDSVVIDDELGGYLATKELLVNNHQKILLVDIENQVFENRKAGMRRAFEEANIKFSDLGILTFNEGDYTNHDDMLANKLDTYKPTAIISVTNHLTQHVVKFLRDRNLIIGKDISLIMYDESEWASLENITTISQPFDLMIEKIQHLLSKAIFEGSKEKKISKVTIKPTVVRRKSVNKI